MTRLRRALLAFSVICTACMASGTASATIPVLMPPEPLEGETGAFMALMEAIPVMNDPERLLRNLNVARDKAVGPTKLRGYIDCLRVGPLTDRMNLAISLSDSLYSGVDTLFKTERAAKNVDPLSSAIKQNIRPYPAIK